MPRADLIINFVAFQAGWLVAVAGAAYGHPLAGVLYAVVFLVLHHWRLDDARMPELVFVAASALLGFLVDSALVLGQFMTFPGYARLGSPTTIWMVSLWVMFAMTLRHSLGWLRGRYMLAGAAGAVAGPLAYWAGSKLGAVELVRDDWSLIAIGAAWTASMIALLALERLTRRFGGASTGKAGYPQ